MRTLENDIPRVRCKDFLSILDFNHEELTQAIELAMRLKRERPLGLRAPTAHALDGRHIGLLFEKPSLRTRVTFTIGVRELGGDMVEIPADVMHADREPMHDVARNLERWVDAVVIRTFSQDRLVQVGHSTTRLHVINALSDEEHPCQALADIQTLKELWGELKGRTVAIVGDGNNVATSMVHASMMLGMSVRVATPKGYELPNEVILESARVAVDGADLVQFTDPNKAVEGADAIYTDVWTSMGQEVEYAERKKIFARYQVNEALLGRAKPDAVFMHCLPAHRGEEVTDEVIESSSSVVFDQAENRLHAQKALLLMLVTPS
ncbi:MAG TPA: ornithine carbamoyltransferase [Vicinamibacterales bacterium]|nr:ornithine carbamoyltransferase [Vicinamibacterales bacterium]